jgi:hypothetical protein
VLLLLLPLLPVRSLSSVLLLLLIQHWDNWKDRLLCERGGTTGCVAFQGTTLASSSYLGTVAATDSHRQGISKASPHCFSYRESDVELERHTPMGIQFDLDLIINQVRT